MYCLQRQREERECENEGEKKGTEERGDRGLGAMKDKGEELEQAWSR